MQYIITKDGVLEQGIALTEEQVAQRKQIADFIHELVCHGGFHSDYERRNSGPPKCDEIANFFVTKFRLFPNADTDMAAETAAHYPQNIEAVEPPAVIADTVAADDIPF